MDQSETRIRSPQGQLVANGGSVGNSLAPGPTAPTPNRTQVHSRFNSLDLRWQRRVHVRHCYAPRDLANGEFETRLCNVCPIWRWPDIGGNALILLGAPDPGAPRGCHVAPFPRLCSRRYWKLRPFSAETGPLGPEGRVFRGTFQGV